MSCDITLQTQILHVVLKKTKTTLLHSTSQYWIYTKRDETSVIRKKKRLKPQRVSECWEGHHWLKAGAESPRAILSAHAWLGTAGLRYNMFLLMCYIFNITFTTWGHFILSVSESVFGCSSGSWGGSEPADLSLTPCVVFVPCRWRAASRCWKSSHPIVWRDFWTHWGVYERVRLCEGQKHDAQGCSHSISLFVPLFFRYTTRHLNDDSTSKQIRALLQWERRGWWWRWRERKKGVHLKEEENEGGNKRQWLINLFVYKEQNKSSPA